MKVYCDYDTNLDVFFKQVVDFVLHKYESSLHLQRLQEIRLIKYDKNATYSSDGHIDDAGQKVYVTSKLFEELPCYDIYLLDGNTEFELIQRTLYHELGHISDYTIMPNLYKAKELAPDHLGTAAFMWLEYCAEKRSTKEASSENFKLCTNFVTMNWEITTNNIFDANIHNFFYLNKLLSYFLAQIAVYGRKDYYLLQIKNSMLNRYILEVLIQVSLLDQKAPFDCITELYGLRDCLEKNYPLLKNSQEAFLCD